MDRFDVICIGVVLLDLPLGPLDEGIFRAESTMVGHIGLTTGGDALNEAVILARLGKKPALIGHIGRDMPGDIIVKRCEEEGVDCSRLRRDPKAETRINVVVIGKDGQRHFIKTHSAVSLSFRPEEIDYDLIGNARAVSLASIFCSKLRDPETILRILKAAKEKGAATFADMVPMTGGETIGDIAEALPFLDYFLPNLEEAAMLTGLLDPDEMADCLLEYGIGTVVVKLGKQGCLIKNSRERHLIPAFQANAVDTTGAGDNFAAGFITAVLDGMDLKACGQFANAVAAVSTETIGASDGVKNRERIETFPAYAALEKGMINAR
ncbi:MAG TPA: carbohydrate kinase family protein [Anaerovoracaceae bacterium]|nr:carbohydrate kinase family protein [Anaerovoracaceae bacterium]